MKVFEQYSDKHIKKLIKKVEEDTRIMSFRGGRFYLYSVLRFQIEIAIREALLESNQKVDWLAFLKQVLSFLLMKIKSATKKEYKTSSSFTPSPYLFIGTSPQRLNNNESSELMDIIPFFKKNGFRINFSIPKYPIPDLKVSSIVDKFEEIDMQSLKPVSLIVYLKIFYLLFKIKRKIGINLYGSLNHLASFFSQQYHFSKQLHKQLLQAKPRLIFTRSFYTEAWIGMAIKDLDIEVVEVQHGLVADSHVYYQVLNPNSKASSYYFMPNYILTLGKESANVITRSCSYFSEENTFVLGTSNYQASLEAESSEKKRIVFMLQGNALAGALDLSDFILQFLMKYKQKLDQDNFQVIVRPHPIQVNEVAGKFSNISYVEIEDPNKVKSMDTILKAFAVISSTSFCLYEAASVGVRAFAPLKFSEMNLKKGISFFEDENELIKLILSSPKPKTVAYIQALDQEILKRFFYE